MKYKKDLPAQDFEKALGLDKSQVNRLQKAIAKAYIEVPIDNGWNVDNLNFIVAPYIKTQEEAFYVATVILTDVIGAIIKTGATPFTVN